MIVAAAALLDDARVLVQRRAAGRAHAGLWEFPGGKLEPSETAEAALIRELHEELGIDVDQPALVPVGFASDPAQSIVLLLYAVTRWRGEPTALDAAELAWVPIANLDRWPMPPLDVPLSAALGRWISVARS